ncbi:MAG: CehA/McbA family metallohydrolase domain-containing protein [Armatimonadota bacterium]
MSLKVIGVLAFSALCCASCCAYNVDGKVRMVSGSDWIAGSTTSFEVEFTAGAGGVPVGGSVAVAFLHAVFILPSTNPNTVGYVKVVRESGEDMDVKYVEWPPKGTFPLAMDRKATDHNLRHGVFARVVNTSIKPGEKIRFIFGADGKGIAIPRTVCDKPMRIALDLKGDEKYYAIQDVPGCGIVGGPVHQLFITVPSTRTVGEDADICIRAEDEHTNLATVCNMRVKLSGIPSLPENSVQLKNGLARVIIPVKNEGIFRVTVTGGTMSARSNPMIVSAKPRQYNVYWGDLHGHTSLSDGLAPDADYYYAYARDAADLDVCASAEHGVHPEARESTRKFNDPGKFVTIWGYEWAESVPGRLDRNLYFHSEDDSIPEYPASIGELWQSVERLYGDNKDRRIIIGPHMFTYKTKAKPWYETWDTRYERFAEIYSEHGMSEFKGNPRMLAGGDVADGYFAQDGLKYGRRFGMIASSDTHDSHPGRGGNSLVQHGGMVAFLAKDLTRDSVWDAWWNRRVYAATTDRIYIDFQIDGHLMGEEFETAGKPKIEFTVHGCDDKFDVFLIKNNDVIKTTHATDGTAKMSFADDTYDKSSYYYLRVVQDNGEWAWSSPIWVDKLN